MPTLHRRLLCRVDACPGSPILDAPQARRPVGSPWIHGPAMPQYRKDVARRFGLKLAASWIDVPFTPRLRPFLAFMAEQERAGIGRLGSAYFRETLAYDEDAEWYILVPRREFNRRHRKAGADETLGREGLPVHASERFREAVERSGSTGMAFGPTTEGCRPIPGDPRRWFECLPTAPAGRGIDHPWAPPTVHDVAEGDGRLGSSIARNDTALLDRMPPEVTDLAGSFPPGEFHIGSHPRLWRAALPETDFAGLVKLGLFRGWSVSTPIIRREAAAVLIGAGVLRPDMLQGVEIVTNRELADAPILDEVAGPFPRSFLEKLASRPMDAAPAQTPEPTAEPHAHEPQEVTPIDPSEVAAASTALGVTIPNALVRLLTEVGCVAPFDYPSCWKVLARGDTDAPQVLDDELPDRLLVVGSDDGGNDFAIDLDHAADGDAPLLYFDHEGDVCTDAWPSLARLLDSTRTRTGGKGPSNQ